MRKEEFRRTIFASATLTGIIIGAGILGLPYVIQKSGVLTGITALLLTGIIFLIINLFLGEIVLRTKGKHQLSGYAEKYLGPNGKRLMSLAMLIITYGALLAYLIGVGISIGAILNIAPFIVSVIYFVLMAFLTYFSIKKVQGYEGFFVASLLTIILVICILLIPWVKPENILEFNFYKLLIPFGVAFFAYGGSVAIPEMSDEIGDMKKLLKRAIIIGTIIPVIVYIIFSFVFAGAMGIKITEVATVGLEGFLGKPAFILGNLFAFFAMSSSFLVVAIGMKDIFNYDYNLGKNKAWLLTILPPFLLFILGFTGFIKTLSIAGSLAMGLEGILIILMFHSARKHSERKPEYELKTGDLLSVMLILIFLIVIVYQIFALF